MLKNSTRVLFIAGVLCFLSCGYLFAAGRDPFIPLVTSDGRLLKLDKEQPQGAGLVVEGIIYDKQGSSYAIINAEVVRVSDRIGDYQVLRIEENKVTLIKEGAVSEIELKKEEVP